MLGLLAAVVGAGLLALLALLALTSRDATLVLDLEPGDCFDVPAEIADDTLGQVDTGDCDDPHEAEVFAVGELNPDRDRPYPAADELFGVADRACAELLAERPELVEQFGVLPVVADESSWEAFRGRYVCVAIPYGGGTVSGSLGF